MASVDDRIADAADEVADKVDEVTGKVEKAARKASAKAADAMVEARGEAAKAGKAAKKRAREAADDSKHFAADAIEGLASAAREVAEKLRDGNSTSARAAEFARGTADRMDDFSARLRDKDLGELADDARSVVRNNPAIALGAAAVIGFALARFLKGDGEA